MKGAIAEPWVKTTSRPSRASMTTIGPNHHFLRTLMKAHSSPMMPTFSLVPSNAIEAPRSVQLVETTPVHVFAQGRLLLLVEDVVPEHQVVHVRPHEAEVGVVGSAHDGLAPDVEGGVDDDRHPGEPAELGDEVVVERALRAGDRLEPGRVVHVGHGG